MVQASPTLGRSCSRYAFHEVFLPLMLMLMLLSLAASAPLMTMLTTRMTAVSMQYTA